MIPIPENQPLYFLFEAEVAMEYLKPQVPDSKTPVYKLFKRIDANF